MGRINRAIELLEQGQPIFYAGVTELGFESGKRHAGTWADYLCVDLEHLPFDMGMSFGRKEAHDPPYPRDMLKARDVVKSACDKADVAFLDILTSETVETRIDEGVKIGAVTEEVAAIGRRYSGRES